MPRYVAFLRGVSPMNLKMADLRTCVESAGFSDPKTVRSSGNVAFTADASTEHALALALEAAMTRELGRSFLTVIYHAKHLRELVKSNPYSNFQLPPNVKRIVTFLREPSRSEPSLPVARDGAHILLMKGAEVFCAYVPNPKGPRFMALIEQTFGTSLTTRTWETVEKCAVA